MSIFQTLSQTPMDLMISPKGLWLPSDLASIYYPQLLMLVNDGLATVGQYGDIPALFLTEKGIRLHKEYLESEQKRLLEKMQVLEQATKTEDKVEVQSSPLPAGAKRFRDLKAKERFRIMVGKSVHSLYFRKLSDAEDDNAISDSESKEKATFPEDQLVFPAP